MTAFPARALALVLTALAPAPAAATTLLASFYGAESGRLTASGAPFRPMGRTAAHPSWAFGTRFRACLEACAIGTVTDRGPAAWTGRGIDLSQGLARAIGLEARGVARVEVEILASGRLARRRARHHRHSSRRSS